MSRLSTKQKEEIKSIISAFNFSGFKVNLPNISNRFLGETLKLWLSVLYLYSRTISQWKKGLFGLPLSKVSNVRVLSMAVYIIICTGIQNCLL